MMTWLPSVALVIVAVVFAATTWYESAEEAAVRTAVGYYIKGAQTADAADFERAFAVEIADMKWVWKDPETGVETLGSRPITEAIESWTKAGKAESWGKVVDVRIVDDKLAHATIELLWQEHLYVDVMSLYKVNGEWKIVNKTFVSRGEKASH
jgi:hypothetical protein